MGIYGIEDESSVDWEKLYKFCGVHFQRSVERVKTNFNVVPNGRQGDLQKLVNVLLSETTTEEEFLDAVETILREFPNTLNWLRWYLEHFRGTLIFPAMQKGTITGFGIDTNGGEVTGRWFQTRAKVRSGITRPTLEQGLGVMMREGMTIESDYSYELAGQRTAYGARSNPISREKARANKRSSKGQKRNYGQRSIESLWVLFVD